MLCNLGIESLQSTAQVGMKIATAQNAAKQFNPEERKCKTSSKYRRSASKFFCILQFDPWHGRNKQTSVPNVQTNKLDKSADKNALSNHCIHTTPPNSSLPPSFSQESLMRHNTGILQRDKWFVVRTKGPWHKKMSKRSGLENDWTCWKWSFLDFQICQKDRCAATIEYHRPWGCHSCQSIPVLSKGTESVSYSCLGQIDERWRWTKESKVLKSNDHRRTEKCQMLRQRDNCWGQRRVEMTWRYYFGTMPQNSHSTNKRSRALVALSIWGSSSIRWGRQSSTP